MNTIYISEKNICILKDYEIDCCIVGKISVRGRNIFFIQTRNKEIIKDKRVIINL